MRAAEFAKTGMDAGSELLLSDDPPEKPRELHLLRLVQGGANRIAMRAAMRPISPNVLRPAPVKCSA